MMPKERMKKAMNLEEPDLVPVMCQMSIGHMLLQTKFSPAEFWFSSEVFAEGLLALREVYDFDGILVSLHGHPEGWEKDVVRIQKDERGEMVSWKNGDRTFFPCDDLPQHFPAIKTPFPEIAAFDPAAIPDCVGFIPVSQGLNFLFDREHLYDIFDIILEKAGSSYSIHGEVTSPFDYFLSLFGHEQALLSLIDEPARAKEILQRYTEGVKKIALGIAAKGVDAIKVSSPFAGAGFISPQFYREFVLPYESEIAKAVRARGVPVYLHTCGAINDRLEMMAEAGFSGIECLDPPPLGNVLLEDAKMRVGDKIFIKGNLDPVNELLAGTPESVWEAAARRIEVGKPGGGYILSTACSIAPHTRRENIRVLARVAAQLGS